MDPDDLEVDWYKSAKEVDAFVRAGALTLVLLAVWAENSW